MYCYLLQDWVTVRGVSSITAITQLEAGWFNTSMFQDAVAWLEVKDTTFGGGTAPVIAFQSSPTKDDVFFVTIGSLSANTSGTSAVAMLKETPTGTPLSSWLRWQLQSSSTATWDVTFRVYCALNAIGSNRPAIPPA